MEKTWLKENAFRALLVTVACLAGAGYGSYQLYLDWLGEASRGSGPSLAQVARRDQTVRRKSAKSFAWVRAEESDALYKKDSVQTSTESAAVIKFANGNSLEIGENSLVVIDDIEKLELNFATMVTSGSVVLRTAEGDKRLSVGGDGKVKVEKIPVRLIAPEPLARFYVGDAASAEIDFQWKAGDQKPANLFVLVSSDRAFSPGKTVKLEADAKASAFTSTLKPGKYYWRLDDAQAPLTEISQFTVVAVSAPRPAFPARGEEIASPQLSFRWTGGDLLATDKRLKTTLEVAADPSFTKVLQSTPIQVDTLQKALALEAALAGKNLSWRTKVDYPGGSVLSKPETFRLMAAAEVQTGKLALVAPEKDAKAWYWEKPIEFKFVWKSENTGAVSYVLEFAADAEFKKVIASKPVQAQSLTSIEAGVPTGTSFWRVRSLSVKNAGQEVARSEARAITYGVHPPLRAPASVMAKPGAGATYELADDNDNPKLAWEKLEDAAGYQIAVFKDGKPIAQKTTTDNFITLPELPEGKLSWTVRGVDRLKRPGELMERQEFNLSFGAALGAPVVTSPEVQ